MIKTLIYSSELTLTAYLDEFEKGVQKFCEQLGDLHPHLSSFNIEVLIEMDSYKEVIQKELNLFCVLNPVYSIEVKKEEYPISTAIGGRHTGELHVGVLLLFSGIKRSDIIKTNFELDNTKSLWMYDIEEKEMVNIIQPKEDQDGTV